MHISHVETFLECEDILSLKGCLSIESWLYILEC